MSPGVVTSFTLLRFKVGVTATSFTSAPVPDPAQSKTTKSRSLQSRRPAMLEGQEASSAAPHEHGHASRVTSETALKIILLFLACDTFCHSL